MSSPQAQQAAVDHFAETQSTTAFYEALNQTFVSQSAQAAVKEAAQILACKALEKTNVIDSSAIRTIEAMVAELDRKLSEQLHEIIHHPEFQKMESAWRGLHYLVNNTEVEDMLKIKVMSVSKEELRKSLMRYKGITWDQSPFFKQVYEEEYGKLGGQPFGCLVADYEFDHTTPDVELLREISRTAAAAHCPFITATSPNLVQMDTWQELSNPRDLIKIFKTPEYIAWQSLRDSEDSRYLVLTLPRVLARLPYGANTLPVEGFAFEEKVSAHNHYTWMNSSYAMAVNINRSFKLYGWCTSIRGVEAGGLVENLPCHTFPADDGGVDVKCPTEISISDRREKELADCGLMPLQHIKNTDQAVFVGAQTLQSPKKYYNDDTSANAQLSTRLPYIFAVSRFAHYLKSFVRNKLSTFTSRAEMQATLNDWILNYVLGNPEGASHRAKAERPLSAAEVFVEDVKGNPGYYTARISLVPHYQLEGITISLSLVTKVPSEQTANRS